MDSTDPPRPDPFDDVRAAFGRLGTSEKAAFVFEATFGTLGQALEETGRRVSAAIDDLDVDAWFRTPPRGPRPPRRPRPPRSATPPPRPDAPSGPITPEGPLGTPPADDLPLPDDPPPDAT